MSRLAFGLPFYLDLGDLVLSVISDKCPCYFQIVKFGPGEMIWLDGCCGQGVCKISSVEYLVGCIRGKRSPLEAMIDLDTYLV